MVLGEVSRLTRERAPEPPGSTWSRYATLAAQDLSTFHARLIADASSRIPAGRMWVVGRGSPRGRVGQPQAIGLRDAGGSMYTMDSHRVKHVPVGSISFLTRSPSDAARSRPAPRSTRWMHGSIFVLPPVNGRRSAAVLAFAFAGAARTTARTDICCHRKLTHDLPARAAPLSSQMTDD